MAQKKIDLSLVVAAYNEEVVIVNNLQRIITAVSARAELEWELVCVNDGSRDRTGELLDQFAAAQPRVHVLHHYRNFGQGRALRTAFAVCLGEIIVTLDADLSYSPEHIFWLVDALQQQRVDIALASPYMKGGQVENVPLLRRVLSRYGNLYLAKMSHYAVATSTCVVRAYRREVIENLFLTSDGMELQIEILMKASLLGFRVCEVPSRLKWSLEKADATRAPRVSKMKIQQAFKMYLFMGWLSKPATIFIFLAMLLLGMGGWLTLNSVRKFFSFLDTFGKEELMWAISHSLKATVNEYYYGLVFATIFLLFGFLMFVFALLILQSKFYFEELYRLGNYLRFSEYQNRLSGDPVIYEDPCHKANQRREGL